MPPNNFDTALEMLSVLGHYDSSCPRCAAEMEPIASGAAELLREVRLCPSCYLVTWRDADGLHVRQGVPTKKGADTRSDPAWCALEPKKC